MVFSRILKKTSLENILPARDQFLLKPRARECLFSTFNRLCLFAQSMIRESYFLFIMYTTIDERCLPNLSPINPEHPNLAYVLPNNEL